MGRIFFLVLCFLLLENANSASTYDQRQTGDLNIQVDLKDLQIIALLKGGKEEYVDYDYAYDYSEMTIKPQNGTTPKPLNDSSTAIDTGKDNTTVAATVITEQTTLPTKNNNSLEIEITMNPAINDSTTTIKTLDVGSTNELSETHDSTITKNETTTPMPSNCKKGLVVNKKGECELKMQGTGNALLKLVKLSQRLKLRRDNRKNQHPDESV